MAVYGPEKFTLKIGKTITIKHFEPEYANKFPLFVSQIARETTHTSHYEGRQILIDEIEKKWRAALNSHSHLELGAFDDGRLIAQLSLRQSHPDHPWTRHIGEFGMGILQDYWSQGLGSRMIEIMENISNEINISRLESRVRSKNYRGINFYLRHGYEIEGTRKQAALINEQFEKEYYISKILTVDKHQSNL